MKEELLFYINLVPLEELDWNYIDKMINLIYEQEDN